MSERSSTIVNIPGLTELGFFLFLAVAVVTWGWSPRCAVEDPYEAPEVQP